MSDSGNRDVSRHLPRIFRVALRILGDREMAEDVVQDVCLRALDGEKDFRGQSQFTSWLHRITVNRAIDILRKQQREVHAMEHYNSQFSGRPASGISPGSQIERRELAEIATAMVGQLPDDCRSSFVLTQLDGYSYDEAAEIVGVARGTVASRVYRAKKLLLQKMQDKLA